MVDRLIFGIQEVHLIVLEVELLLQCSDGRRPRVHLLPNPLLDEHLGFDNPGEAGGLFLLVDEVADYFRFEFVDHLVLRDALQPGEHELCNVSLPHLLEVLDVVVAQEVAVGSIEPLALAHLLESPGELVGVMLYYWLNIPNLGSFALGPVPEEHIQLYLPILVPEDIVPVPLDGGEDLESARGGLLYLLLMGEAASILDRNEISHILIELGVDFKDTLLLSTYFSSS